MIKKLNKSALQKLLIECLTTTHNAPQKAYKLARERAPANGDEITRIAKAMSNKQNIKL